MLSMTSVKPTGEGCGASGVQFFDTPKEFIDYSFYVVKGAEFPSNPNESRLITPLREAAQMRRSLTAGGPKVGDAKGILLRAAEEFFWARNGGQKGLPSGTEKTALALADLSVTGRLAYEDFRRVNPKDADLLPLLKQRLAKYSQATDPVLQAAIDAVLDRAYQVAWALCGTVKQRQESRKKLGWIAVSGEDDPPHHPVNAPCAPHDQHDLKVTVKGIEMTLRYIIAKAQPEQDNGIWLPGRALPPERMPVIPEDHHVILFIHGHSSRAEEALDLAGPLFSNAAERGKKVAIIALDLPNCGYSSMFDHLRVAAEDQSQRHQSPLLDFLEETVIAFVNALDAKVHVKDRIVSVIGGSLGGNLGLRLGKRSADNKWLSRIVSWSAASVWNSYDNDALKGIATGDCRGRMNEAEDKFSRYNYFFRTFDETRNLIVFEIAKPQPYYWYREGWEPCKTNHINQARCERREIYNQYFRRWHWRVALEQLLFSHQDNIPGTDTPKAQAITSRVMLCAGEEGNYGGTNIYDATHTLAKKMTKTPGYTLFLKDTGHSIHNERPKFFADQIIAFAYDRKSQINAGTLISKVIVRVNIGGDDFRGDSRAKAYVVVNGKKVAVELNPEGTGYSSGSYIRKEIELPAPAKAGDITCAGVEFKSGGDDWNADNCNFNALTFQFVTASGGIKITMLEKSGDPVWRFYKNADQIYEKELSLG